MKTTHIWRLAIVALCLHGLAMAKPPLSLLFEARTAAYHGTQWLLARQQENGSWSGDLRLTTRAVTVLSQSGYAQKERTKQAIARAVAWMMDAPATLTKKAPAAWEEASDRAAALAACEAAPVDLPTALADWRGTLLRQVLEAQSGNGCWQEGEKDSEAATIHALLALVRAGGEALQQVP